MNCLEITAKVPPTLVQGADALIDLFVRDKKTKFPVDISGATEIVVILQNTDLTFLELKLSLSQVAIINGPGGYYQATVTNVQSALLKLSAAPLYSDVEAHITISAKETIVLYPQSLNIVSRLFPTAP